MGQPCTIADLKKKRESLMSAIRGYNTKIKKTETSGAGTCSVYKPTGFAYKYMNSFLGAIYKCNPSTNNEDNLDQPVENLITNQHHEDDTITVAEIHAANGEVERPFLTSGGSSMDQVSPYEQTAVAMTSKRRQHNPPDLKQAKKLMDEAFNILKKIAQPKLSDEEDECSLCGKLVAKKMRTLTEERRDLMMIKINQIFYTERQEQNMSISSLSRVSTRPPSSLSTIQHDDDVPELVIITDTVMPGSDIQGARRLDDNNSLCNDFVVEYLSEDIDSEGDPETIQQTI